MASFFMKALSCFLYNVNTQRSLLISLFDHRQHLFVDWLKLRQIHETVANPSPELTLAMNCVLQ